MVKIEFELAVFIYLLVSIFGFLAVWLASSKIKTPQRHRRQIESIWQCAICTYIYVDSKHKRLSSCPRCGSYNERANETYPAS